MMRNVLDIARSHDTSDRFVSEDLASSLHEWPEDTFRNLDLGDNGTSYLNTNRCKSIRTVGISSCYAIRTDRDAKANLDKIQTRYPTSRFHHSSLKSASRGSHRPSIDVKVTCGREEWTVVEVDGSIAQMSLAQDSFKRA